MVHVTESVQLSDGRVVHVHSDGSVVVTVGLMGEQRDETSRQVRDTTQTEQKQKQSQKRLSHSQLLREVVHRLAALPQLSPPPSAQRVAEECVAATERGYGVDEERGWICPPNLIRRFINYYHMPQAYRIADIAHRGFVSVLAGVTVYGTFTLLSGYSNHKKMRLEALEKHEREVSLKDDTKGELRVDEQRL